MSYNKYCNQDLWCANSKLLCSKKLDYEQLTKLRFHFGFFALKTLRNTRSCTDEFTYYLNFSSGNYLSISDAEVHIHETTPNYIVVSLPTKFESRDMDIKDILYRSVAAGIYVGVHYTENYWDEDTWDNSNSGWA